MTKVAGEVIDDLLTGTLSNELDRFVDADFNVLEKKKKLFYLYINEGLTDLYSQFRLKVDELFLATTESRTDYPITTEHFIKNEDNYWSAPDYEHYLWKNEFRPWEDNLIQILDVYDHHGMKMPMNDSNSPFSVFTPESNVLSIPIHPAGEYAEHVVYDYERNIVELIHPSNPLNEPLSKRTINMVYTVVYQCNHTKVTKDEDKIILPQHLLGLLHSYVAYKIFSNMNTESAVSNSAKLFQEYQLGIQKIKQESLVEPENKPLNNKFNNRGFI